ncbi:unnamed protein product [Cutaneotrichosporon oleaginosum]
MLARLLLLALPALAQTSTIDISNIITQGLVPSVGTAAPGAAATELAGESPLTDTRINFPTMLDWWVVGALNQVEWTFVHPSKDAEEVTMDLILDNLDTTLCPEPVKVTSVRAHWGKWGGTSQLEGARPGEGYFLVLLDSTNSSEVYSESENFELRPAGAVPTHEWDPSASGAPAANAPAASTPAASPTPGGTSGAGRLSPGWLVGAAFAAVMM